MTDKELIEHLSPLEPKMKLYNDTKAGMLSSDDIQLIKKIYPTLQQVAKGQLPRVFLTSCSTCVKSVYEVVISLYFRLKDEDTTENKL